MQQSRGEWERIQQKMSEQRAISFEGCFNFRDFGGLPTIDGRKIRWKRLYRSMTPEWMTEADLHRARSELHIGLVVDLRGEDSPTSGALGLTPVIRKAVGPIRTSEEQGQSMRALWDSPPEDSLPRVLDLPTIPHAVSILASHLGVPTVIHCRLGKDRTGVFSAVLLKLLGVSDEDIVVDYLQTNIDKKLARIRLREMGERPFDEPRLVREQASEVAMRATLRRLEREMRGARCYLEARGLAAEVLDELAADLLDSQYA